MQKAAYDEVVNQKPGGLQLVKSAEVARCYTGTAYDGRPASRMEHARVGPCHDAATVRFKTGKWNVLSIPVLRRRSGRSCCDLGVLIIRKRPGQADVTGRWESTKKE